MRILVVGIGYVGLTTSIGFAELGHEVIGYDTNLGVTKGLSIGNSHIHERGIEESLNRNLTSGNLAFVSALPEDLSAFDYIFICLPTPANADGTADTSAIASTFTLLCDQISQQAIVVIKSTVPVGTARSLKKLNSAIKLVSNPEFLREGYALEDFMEPERIVIGSSSVLDADNVAALYSTFSVPIVKTSHETAELIKYAANGYLAVKLSFVNEIQRISESFGANSLDLFFALGLDSRIGPKHLNPGPGWGGSCLPKDTQSLLSAAMSKGVELHTLKAAVSSNELSIANVVSTISVLVGQPSNGKTVAILGLAFKANTGDLRESPAIKVANQLRSGGYTVKGYDPVVRQAADFPGEVAESVNDCILGADALVVMTEWEEFTHLDSKEILNLMSRPNVVDTRQVLDRTHWAANGAVFPKVAGSFDSGH
jgi:UDPglucose 6-dehydrogenase